MTSVENLDKTIQFTKEYMTNLFSNIKKEIEHLFLTVDEGEIACNMLTLLKDITNIEKEVKLDIIEIDLSLKRLHNHIEQIIDIKNKL